MEEISLQRLRELILDIHSFVELGVEFDTNKALELGYSETEIEIASKILAINQNSSLNNLFKSKILFCNPDFQSKKTVYVYYVMLAKLIFVFDEESDIYSHIFEEDLEEKVRETQKIITTIEYFDANPTICDVYGNPI